MASISECSVCGSPFEPQFRYQMEEIRGGFAFYCSQACLEKSQKGGGEGSVTCDACAKNFRVELVSSVLYVGGQRRYACSMECRMQLAREASGVRLGEIASPPDPAPREDVGARHEGPARRSKAVGVRVIAVFNH
jgi:chromosome partitioning protein